MLMLWVLVNKSALAPDGFRKVRVDGSEKILYYGFIFVIPMQSESIKKTEKKNLNAK